METLKTELDELLARRSEVLSTDERAALELLITRKRQRIDYLNRRDKILAYRSTLKDNPDHVARRRTYTDQESVKQRRRDREKAAYKANPELAAKKKANAARRRAEKGDVCRQQVTAWRKEHPNYKSEHHKRKMEEDPTYVVTLRARRRICHALTGFSKSAHTAELIGCTWIELREHIEKQFKPGMTWENRKDWHVDHKLPCEAFNLADPEQQRKCFHFSNLQPLWKLENLKKSAKILPEHLLTP